MSSPQSIRDAVEARLARRHRAEKRFQFYGLAAILAAVTFLALLLGSIAIQSAPAFTAHRLTLPVTLDRALVDPRADMSEASLRRGAYNSVLQASLRAQFPEVQEVGALRDLFGLYSAVNAARLLDQVLADPSLVDSSIEFTLPISDDADLYLKGLTVRERREPGAGALDVSVTEDGSARLAAADGAPVFAGFVEALRADLADRADQADARAVSSETRAAQMIDPDQRDTLRAEAERARAQAARLRDRVTPDVPIALGPQTPSLLIERAGGVVRITEIRADFTSAAGEVLVAPTAEAEASEAWTLWTLDTPAAGRLITDRQIAWTRALEARGLVENGFNSLLFVNADSREPELSGVLGALVGSVLTMLITMVLAVPIGVGAAVYLEEFAPKNRFTDFIEVNINNLAAVPSIVFGLLGLAVFINAFGLPRSAPLVGGMVLALMTLPTVIISSRAALKAVPPSIREAALGVGASKTQAVFHHVLPLAAPGILTGSIIGLAQALGETAPLLMIGMVAFIADPPSLGFAGFTEPATVMPVQIFIWSSSAERAFEARTAAAILVLLAVMVSFNAVAVYLRRRFERRW